MSVIDEVKQKTDIAEIIGQYATLKKAGKNLTALCPFHSEKHPSFFVYPEQQSWHCFGACNTGGDVLSFIMRKESMDFGEALRLLADRVGVVLPSRAERDDKKEEKEEYYKVNEAAALYYNNLLINSPGAEKARAYVENRGFSNQTVSDFQLGFSLDRWEELKKYLADKGYSEETMLAAGLLIQTDDGKTHDRFRGKLMFPIRDSRGRTIGFGARVLDDSLPKYVNSPQTPTFDKSSILYSIDRAASTIRKQDMAIIMEGYMDVITAHQNGITNAVASMGTAVTESQVNTLKRLSKNLVLALDADAAGEEAMLRGVGYENILNAEIRVVVMPEGKDPDDVIRQDTATWQELVTGAIPIVDYTFDMVISRLDLTTARDKSLAVDRLLPIVAEIKDPIRQAHYMQKLAGVVKVGMNTLEAALNRLKPAPVRRKTPERKPAVAPAVRSYLSSQLEEDCLTLLLQYPELKSGEEELPPDYFEISENREIYLVWQINDDTVNIKESLDPALHEHYDKIVSKEFPSNNTIEKRNFEYRRNLEEKYLRNMIAKAQESGKPNEEIIQYISRLKDIQSQRKLSPREARR